MTYSLGIDLGTTYTAAAVLRDGNVEMLGLGAVATAVPTALYFSLDGDVAAGESAIRAGSSDPDGLVLHFKRRLGDPVGIELRGRSMAAHELLAEMLAWTYRRAVELKGGEPSTVVLTHPANWGELKKDLLRESAARAGIVKTHLLTEPDAAATHYAAQQRLAEGALVVIYDLGGGTFDATLLRNTESGFELVGEPLGSDRVGGVDFDDHLWGHIVESLGDSLDSLDLDDPSVRRDVARLRRSTVELKEALSTDTSALLHVGINGIEDLRVTRSEFESLIRESLGESIRAMERLLSVTGVTPDGLHSVLLVGGSSRVPLVGELVTRALGRPVAVDVHPKFAVAGGAARHAGTVEITSEQPDEDEAVAPDVAPDVVAGTVDEIVPSQIVEAAPVADEPPRANETETGPPPSRKRLVMIGAGTAVILAAILTTALIGGGNNPSGPGSGETTRPNTSLSTTAQDLPTIISYQPQVNTGPMVWLSPLPPPDGGPSDYFDLFTDTGLSADSGAGVDVFGLFGGWISDLGSPLGKPSDFELATILASLADQRIAISFEAGALRDSLSCGGGASGFANPAEIGRIIQRISGLGGVVHYATMVTPYDGGVVFDGPDACRWTAEQTATEAAHFVEAVRAVFPNAVIGSADSFGGEPDNLREWLEAYQSVTGEQLGYVHLFTDFDDPQWADQTLGFEEVARSFGVELGVVYRGPDGASDDFSWVSGLGQRVDEYESAAGGHLAHTVIATMEDLPQKLLPTSADGTLVRWIATYSRASTSTLLEVSGNQLNGQLTTGDGAPVPSAEVTISASPRGDSGVTSEYTITGTVPEGVTFADAGFRVNIECDCSGQAELTLFEIDYSEGSSTGNLIAVSDFRDGMNGWVTFGDAAINLVTIESRPGLMLADQEALGMGVNSPIFPVQPGEPFAVTFVADVTPFSMGSGYFNINFQNETGGGERFTKLLQPGMVDLVTVITGPDGAWTAEIPAEIVPPFLIRAHFEGEGGLRSSYGESLVASG